MKVEMKSTGDWRDRTTKRVFVLHTATLGLIPHIPQGPQRITRSDFLSAEPGVTLSISGYGPENKKLNEIHLLKSVFNNYFNGLIINVLSLVRS